MMPDDATTDRAMFEASLDRLRYQLGEAHDTIRALQVDLDNLSECLHDLGVEDWDTSWGARGGAIARAEQIAALERTVPS